MPSMGEWIFLLSCSLAVSLIAHSRTRSYVLACSVTCAAMVAVVVAYTLLRYPLSVSLVANLPFVWPWGLLLGGPMSVLVGIPFAIGRWQKRQRGLHPQAER